jgi:hypothetical protein
MVLLIEIFDPTVHNRNKNILKFVEILILKIGNKIHITVKLFLVNHYLSGSDYLGSRGLVITN